MGGSWTCRNAGARQFGMQEPLRPAQVPDVSGWQVESPQLALVWQGLSQMSPSEPVLEVIDRQQSPLPHDPELHPSYATPSFALHT